MSTPTYAQGARLTLGGLPPVSSSDICVTVGAREGASIDNDNGLATGRFATRLNSTDGDQHNYVFLLFDHLYSAMRFRFTVDATYDALRTIRLTALELMACTDDSYSTAVGARYDATIALRCNDTGLSPIKSIAFSQEAGAQASSYATVYQWDGTENTAQDTDNEVILHNGQWTAYMGAFVLPARHFLYRLRTTYDVFDKQGNLVRQHCTAENSLDVRKLFGTNDVLRRGSVYSVSLTVQPTYLYMLSEPDLTKDPVVKISL